MLETPTGLLTGNASAYPGEDLSRYSYHTGAPLRPLEPDEHCPILFRDLGTMAMGRFLAGELHRLAGPLTPITYMRTADYVEPYTDYEQIGRLIFLRPLLLQPWHSGVPHVYVARAARAADMATVGYVPGSMPLADAGRLAVGLRNTAELREALNGRQYDEQVADTRNRLAKLNAELQQAEKLAGPIRRAFQSSDPRSREKSRHELERLGISENDLCAAWHHLPHQRRQALLDALHRFNLKSA